MRKKIAFLVLIILLLSNLTFFTACEENTETYTVTLYKAIILQDVTITYQKLATIKIKGGEVIGNTDKYLENPMDIRRLSGWFIDKGFKTAWNVYKDKVTCDMSLYAYILD